MKLFKLFMMSILMVLSACSSIDLPNQDPEIEFFAPITTTLENEVEISLQLQSLKSDFDSDPEFKANMKLYDPAGELRAEATLPQNPFMKKGEIYQLITWRGFLEPGEYTLEWSSSSYGGTLITFDVIESESGSYLIGSQKIETITND